MPTKNLIPDCRQKYTKKLNRVFFVKWNNNGKNDVLKQFAFASSDPSVFMCFFRAAFPGSPKEPKTFIEVKLHVVISAGKLMVHLTGFCDRFMLWLVNKHVGV